MGQVNRDSLQGFLSEHIQDGDRVGWLMGLLEPFFRWAESGAYQLAPEASLDPEQVRAAIARATGQEVARVVFISLEHPFPKLPWMTEKVYQRNLRDSLGNSLQGSLRDSLGDSLWVSLWNSLQGSLGNSLQGSLRDSLRASLETSLGNSLEASLRNSLRVSLRVSLWGSLFYLLGFAIAGKPDQVERLVPLIKLLPKVLPLGIKKDEPGVWVVLAA